MVSIEDIKNSIIKKEKCIGKLIDYEELQKLYEIYGNDISEKDFAIEVLEISYTHYRHMKNERKRGRVFLNFGKKRINEINSLLLDEKINHTAITYETLDEIHSAFGSDLEEGFFATQCLGLRLNGYNVIKNNKTFKRTINIPKIQDQEVDIKEILLKIKKSGIINSYISYNTLQELYNEYGKGLTESEFAQRILGISLSMYSKIKNETNKRAKVVDKRIKIISELILKNSIKESRYYTLEEINKICQDNKLEEDEFIQYCVLKNRVFFAKAPEYIEKYREVLDTKEKIYIGRAKISQQFMNENIDIFYDIVNKITRKFRYIKDYFNDDIQDHKQNIIIWAMENLGDIEKNFGDDVNFFRQTAYNQINGYYWGIKMRSLEVNYKNKGKYYKKDEKNSSEVEIDFEDKTVDIQNEVESILDYTEVVNKEEYNKAVKCVKLLKEQAEKGIDKQIAIEKVLDIYGISRMELLRYMNIYINFMQEISEEEIEI